MREVKTSAPGKLYFFGEHAVLAGKKSIAFAIDQRIYCEIKERSDEKIVFHFPEVGVEYREYNGRLSDKETSFATAAINCIKKLTRLRGMTISTRSEMHPGFGTSSASTVAILGALSEFYGLGLSKGDIFNMGCQVVLDVQGEGSGYDIACSTYGGVIEYVRGGLPKQLKHPNNLPMIIGYTKIKADTTKIINHVLSLKQRYPEQISTIFGIIEQIVLLVEDALEKGDFRMLGELMNMNHGLLAALDLSSPELEELIWVSKKAGAIGAKLSGAGRGDCMIALAPGKEKEVSYAINSMGGLAFFGKVGDGLRTE